MSASGNSGVMLQNLVSGDTFNVGSVINDQSNRMIERMIINCNTVGILGGITIQLPTFAAIQNIWNFEISIVDTGNNAGTNNITILPGSGNTVNQLSTFLINTNKGAAYILGGGQADWSVFASAGANTGAGLGSVTSFSAGNLSPLFSSNVATATTTPALTFTLTDQAANTIFAGPATGVPAAPTFRALAAADMPVGTGTVTSFSSGNLSPIFTTNVATATTTPALTFTLTVQEAHFAFIGPNGGSPAAPTFRALSGDDMPLAVNNSGPFALNAAQALDIIINSTTYHLGLVTP